MPRRRKTAAELKLSGQFRRDRHADRLAVPTLPGSPQKPTDLDPVAGELWDLITPQLIEAGIVSFIDGPMIRVCVELWSLYRKAMEAALANPTDKLARTACTNYWTCFDKAAARIGLTAMERAKLPRCVPAAESELEKFSKKRFFGGDRA